MKRKWWLILLVFLLLLPAVWSLFKPGFFSSDDGEWMVIRLTDFHRSVVSGQIPVRWGARLNHGYGYPVFNFLYPLSLYIGEFFHLLGFSFVVSIKIVFLLSFFLGAGGMFWWASQVWGKKGGLVSALFYSYAPYRFLDVYIRGSIGEALAFAFLPWLFGAFYLLSRKANQRWLALGALSLAGLIISHNIMAMLFTALILAYGVWLVFFRSQSRLIRKEVGFRFLKVLVLGLGLAAFFWLPALYDKQFIILDQVTVANFWEHFPSLSQLLLPPIIWHS